MTTRRGLSSATASAIGVFMKPKSYVATTYVKSCQDEERDEGRDVSTDRNDGA